MNAKWKMVGYVTAIFLVGVGLGGILGTNYARHSANDVPSQAQIAQNIRSHLKSRASLSADQIQKIDPIIEKIAGRLEEIHQETSEQVGEIFVDFHAQIAGPAELSAEQKLTLTQMEAEHRERMNDSQKKN